MDLASHLIPAPADAPSMFDRIETGSTNSWLRSTLRSHLQRPANENATNVPAQSLALLNSPFVIELANDWATHVRAKMPSATNLERIKTMFETAVGRKLSRGRIVGAGQISSYF